jgi:phosphoribosylformylglycinamidine synthase
MAVPESLPTPETAHNMGLLPEEFEQIKQVLGRHPTNTELTIFSAIRSGHNPNKKASVWLTQLPRDSDRMLAGKKNAGLVDIGDGLACSFRVESYNQFSSSNSDHDATTGPGASHDGIMTSEITIARLNSLHFGDPQLAETRQSLRDVVERIHDGGNTSGIPNVGGKLYFDQCYNADPLVEVFSARIVEAGKVADVKPYNVGNTVLVVAKPTSGNVPAEALHEISATGHAIEIRGIGGTGLVGSIARMIANGEHGLVIDLDNVPIRQPDTAPGETLLAESQGQVLVVAEAGNDDDVRDVCEKWGLACGQIGNVTAPAETGVPRLQIYHHGELVADVAVHDLVMGNGAPQDQPYDHEPAYIAEYAAFDIDDVDDLKLDEVKKVAAYLIAHPTICSRQWMYKQYGLATGTANHNTDGPSDAVVMPIRDAVPGVAGLPETNTSLVMTVDGNSRYVHASPRQGAMIALVEAARNIVCSGGDPLAVTINLNAGNPDVPEEYWQFVEAVQGIGEACRRFSTPVMSSDAHFHNRVSDSGSIFPTPTVGMLGLMEDPGHRMTLNFKNEGDRIYLIGPTTDDIASSEYLYSYRNVKAAPAPFFDFQTEWRVQEGIRTMIRNGWIQSAHDVSGGGLFITLAESAMAGEKGFAIESNERYRMDAFLFGEGQSRVVVTVSPEHFHHIEAYLDEGYNVFTRLGSVTAADFVVDETVIMTSAEAQDLYDNALGKLMEEE